jgi:hypothetical protein
MQFLASIRYRVTAAIRALTTTPRTNADILNIATTHIGQTWEDAIQKLAPEDVASVRMIAGGAEVSDILMEDLLQKVMTLDVEDQVRIVRHIAKNNPTIARMQSVRDWLRAPSVIAEVLLPPPMVVVS